MSDDRADLIALIEPLARLFFGEPNRQLSSKTELRFGTNGSKSVKLETGEWYDHELKEGGGVLALIRREVRVETDAECFAWLESKGLWSNGKARSNGKEHAATVIPVIVHRYKYEDDSGTVAFAVERIEFQNPDGSFVLSETGKRKKTFRQKRPDHSREGRWLHNVDGAPVVPYKLPELMEAVAAAHPVLVVEGEGKVDLLRSWGVPATCCSGGACKWRPEHAKYLHGADVVILPDNDEPGRAHRDTVGTTLQGVAARVRVLELPGLGAKQDIVDWAAKGGTVEQLHELVEREAKPWAPGTPTRFALSLDEWLKRDFPPPDCLLGNWLTTTSRVLLFAPTGIGKTMLTMGMLMATAAGIDFLHWRGVRQARVLLIDGEMSRRLMQQRLADEASRLGVRPEGMHILSREDVEGFAPLNTPQGQQMVERCIQEIGGVDLIDFDNISSLLVGDQKDGEVWRQTLPWALSLTKRNIGQIWVHHTGHDESHSYGDKTREFQMDTTIQLERAEDDNGQLDVNFKFRFIKARERTPATRADFAAVKIALVADQWTCDAPDAPKAQVSPLALKFLDALRNATIGNEANRMYGCPAASIEMWRAECVRCGLLDKDKPNSARSLFSKHKLELIGANRVACNDTMAWITR